MKSTDLEVHVLFRCSKKTGKVDTTATALGKAMLDAWALQNTPSSKMCLVFNRRTGELVYHTEGTKDGFPQVRKYTTVPTCEDFGISLEDLHNIKDERFDGEQN